MVDRDPNTIKQEIDQTRDQLAATIDSSPSAPTPAASPTTQKLG